MEPSEIRRRALLAATKVTLSVIATGCGGLVSAGDDGAAAGAAGAGGTAAGGGTTATRPAAGTGGATVANAGSGGATGGSAAAGAAGAAPTSACTGTTTPPFSDATLTCCNTLLKATFADGAASDLPASDDVVACCTVAAMWFDGPHTSPLAFAYGDVNSCCGIVAPELLSGPLCSPWGPPMPPAMPASEIATPAGPVLA